MTNSGDNAQGRISVILPNFNDGAVIGSAVSAMLEQSRQPFEIIIIDDGSTDNSIQVIEKLCMTHDCIKLIKSPINEGVVAAQNRGIEQVTGDYIYLAAADDMVLAGFFEQAARPLDEHAEAAYSVCDMYLQNDLSAEPINLHMGIISNTGYINKDEFCARHAQKHFHIPTCSVIYRYVHFCEVMPIDRKLHWHGDYFVNYVLAFRYGICYVPKALVLRKEGRASYGSGSRDWSQQSLVLTRWLELLKSSRFLDVAKSFSKAAVTPDTQWRFSLMLTRPQFRWYWSSALARRMLRGGVLHLLAPLTPKFMFDFYYRTFHGAKQQVVGEGASPSSDDTRFAFGENWRRFLAHLNDDRIVEAEQSLCKMLGAENLEGKSFLDIGSGSGLFSLAARRLGARVHSFDFDAQSVACTAELKQRYYPDDENWTVEQGSALDDDYIKSLGSFDVVYSWGVLHHTGSMWQGLENAILPVTAGGQLFIAIYNDQGWISNYWAVVKRLYNSNALLRLLMIIVHVPYLIGVRILVRLLTGRLKIERGMTLWYDMLDWLGGYPFEVATPKQIIDFYLVRNFSLERSKTCGNRHGCNEFVFLNKTDVTAK